MPAKNMPGRKALKCISGRKAALQEAFLGQASTVLRASKNTVAICLFQAASIRTTVSLKVENPLIAVKTTLSVNGFPRRACPSIRLKKLKRSEV